MDHHLYRESSDTWVKEPSQPQPYIKLLVRVQSEDYEQFGFIPQVNQRAITVADTGCQLGLRKHKLIPVKMKMHAADNNNINIFGAAILRFSGQDEAGNVVETRQLTYVTDTSDWLFFSKEACIALRMITDRFPTVGEVPQDQCNTLSIADRPPQNECVCPKRTPPPPRPKEPPVPATEENHEKPPPILQLQYFQHLRASVPTHD